MKPGTLVELILSGARRAHPAKPAVLAQSGSLAYEELLAGARGIAATLREAGARRGERIGVWMEKTPACVQALLGILLSGAAYVPLDPRAPLPRVRQIVEDCGLDLLVVDAGRSRSLPELLSGRTARLVLIEGEPSRASELARAVPLVPLSKAATRDAPWPPPPAPDDLAYVLYTSGSTGTPKGVVHTHRSGTAFARWIQERFGIVADDLFSSHAPFHFDLSISDLYASLGTGASVRLISHTEAMLAPYLVRKAPEWGLTVWYSVPSILSGMIEVGELEKRGLPGVRLLFFAGEVFPTPQLRRLRNALPGVRMFNLFGPTETNVCTYYEVPEKLQPGEDAPIPIGRACENMETFVIDDGGHPVDGPGTEGTLWAKGDNLMRGYWNDPERTAAILKPDPRGGGGVACCTGDRVRLRLDGDYEFLGRRDHMVKVRGYRVELGEIEHVLAAHPAVVEAVAVPIPDVEIGNRLVASVVRRRGCSVDAAALRAFCAERLPGYMVPGPIEVRDALPRTSTGKADRTALRDEWQSREAR
jgi:amino acid adenylation domain-containing protein